MVNPLKCKLLKTARETINHRLIKGAINSVHICLIFIPEVDVIYGMSQFAMALKDLWFAQIRCLKQPHKYPCNSVINVISPIVLFHCTLMEYLICYIVKKFVWVRVFLSHKWTSTLVSKVWEVPGEVGDKM